MLTEGLLAVIIALVSGGGGIFYGAKGKMSKKDHKEQCPVNSKVLLKERHDELCGQKIAALSVKIDNLAQSQNSLVQAQDKIHEKLDEQSRNITTLLALSAKD